MSFGAQRQPLTRDGFRVAGNTASRPQGLTDFEAGITYFDQELGKFLVWSGSAWLATEATPIDLPAPAAEEADIKVAEPVKIVEAEAETAEAKPAEKPAEQLQSA